ncbi:hypothetical protein AB6806_23805 [Bosea sp. RCC_152_1]|uniref:hypothetical protein n=1 Tax=Bosea sp. RCC_152_1 TaxID=3239228 RepID=UPI003524131D
MKVSNVSDLQSSYVLDAVKQRMERELTDLLRDEVMKVVEARFTELMREVFKVLNVDLQARFDMQAFATNFHFTVEDRRSK